MTPVVHDVDGGLSDHEDVYQVVNDSGVVDPSGEYDAEDYDPEA